ncbi:MAG: hypothetical protein AB7P40_10080, partial [Chloroflexota bacterium]
MFHPAQFLGALRSWARLSTILRVLLLGAFLACAGQWSEVEVARAISCSPRPPVGLRITQVDGGRLQAVVTAGAGNLRQVTVRDITNVTVSVNGRSVNSAGESVAMAPGTTFVTLLVTPTHLNQPVTVP